MIWMRINGLNCTTVRTHKNQSLSSHRPSFGKKMFFVIPKMPSKPFVMVQKKLPDHLVEENNSYNSRIGSGLPGRSSTTSQRLFAAGRSRTGLKFLFFFTNYSKYIFLSFTCFPYIFPVKGDQRVQGVSYLYDIQPDIRIHQVI